MSAVAVVITAAMIRIVSLPLMWRHTFCETCGEEMSYRVETGECLCGSCLIERRSAFRAQNRSAAVARVRQDMAVELEEREAARQALLDFEGDDDALTLAKDGYFDVVYEEFVGSETEGPQPRWVESTKLCNHVTISPGSLGRAIFCLMVGIAIPQILKGALRNASIQLHEAKRVSDGFRDFTELYDGTDDRDLGDDVLPWLHRDPSSRSILNRWNRPEDELAFMESIRSGHDGIQLRSQGATDGDGEDGEDGVDDSFQSRSREGEWYELMVDFRRRKLDGLLKVYFGLDDYRASMIVLKWEKGSSGRWKPAQQMNVVEWVRWSCEQSGSILGGLQSCTRSIQIKNQLRQRKEDAANRKIWYEQQAEEAGREAWAAA